MAVLTLEEYKRRKKEGTLNEGSNTNDVTTVNGNRILTLDEFKNTSQYKSIQDRINQKTSSSILLPTKTTNNQQQTEQYVDTGKTYGDYWYQEYGKRKDDKIYSKGGKYYVFNSRTGQYDDVDRINYMTTKDLDKKQLEEAQSLGYKGNKADLAKISNKILLDTGDLSKKEYADYAKNLKRQEEKLDKEQAEKTKIRYSGTGIDALKQIGTKASDVAYTADKEIIAPIKNAKENYNIGKQNNELAIEYYKKMEGQKNNAEELEEKINKYNRYNQDLITSPGAAGNAIQNMDTQVQSALKSGGTAGILGILGGIGGFAVGGAPGAVAGAKALASLGYAVGSMPYTYKLEAGNTYKDLVEQGIPQNIAKDLARKTGAINAAIESGENILDIITFKQAGKILSKPQQMIYDELKKTYGEKALKTLLVNTGYSYGQNILSESMEEMAQEGTSILAEREAYKKIGSDRPVTDKEDLNRILEAGKSAAISTMFTAPLTSAGGTIVNNVVTNLQIKAKNNVNSLTNTDINNQITNEIINFSKENNTTLTEGEVLQIQENVNNNLEQNNITVIDNQNNNTVLPTVEDIVNQEKNNQNINLPTRDNINQQNNVYQYQTSGNEKIDNLRKSAVENNFNNSESTINYMNMLEQIIADKNVDIVFDPNLKDSQGRMANGKYENGIITINPNSNRAGEFIAIHELTHAIGTDSMKNIIQEYRKSNAEFDAAVQQLLKNYNINELNEEAMADVAGQLFGNQEFINNLSRTQPSLFRQLYNEIKYLWHQFRGYKNQNEFIEDLQYKWEQAYRSNTELNSTSNYYIEKVASFNEKEYNNTNQEIIGNREYANLATIINSSTQIQPGKNIIEYVYDYETKSYKDYEIYYKEPGQFKVIKSKISESDTNAKYSTANDSRNEETRSGQVSNQLGERMVENTRKSSTDDGLSNINKGETYSARESNRYDRQNSRELDNSSFSLGKQLAEGAYKSAGTQINDEIIEMAKSGNYEVSDLQKRHLKFVEEHKSDFDNYPKKGTKSGYYIIDNNLVKLTTTTEDNKIFIDELYVEKQNQGTGTKVAKALLDYAEQNGYTLETSKELSTAKGFWDKVLNRQNKEVTNIKDNKGRTLSKQQQDFFKDSKVRDENGNLLTLYHGTRNDFTIFDINKAGASSKEATVGFWFTENENGAKQFSNEVWYGENENAKAMETYLNIENPKIYQEVDNTNQINNLKQQQKDVSSQLNELYNKYDITFDFVGRMNEGNTFENLSRYINNSESELKSTIKEWTKTDNVDEYYNDLLKYTELNKEQKKIENQLSDLRFTDSYEQFRSDIYKIAGKSPTDANFGGTGMALDNQDEVMSKYINNLKEQGYDGIIIKGTNYDSNRFGENNNQYVAFYPNQIKNVDNLNPTTNNDIRYSKNNQTWQSYLEENFESKGTKTNFKDVLLPTQKDINKVNLPTNEDINLRSLEENAPTVEKNDLGYIPQDPTRESSYDNEITDSIKETLADPITEFKRSLDREMEENIKSPKKIKENNDIKRKTESMWSDFQEKFVNRNYEIDKLAKQTKNREIMFKGDMLNSVAGETSGEINVAQTDNYGRRIGESLNSLFKNSKKKGYYEQFDDYLKHYSNIDRHGYGKGSAVPLEYSQKMVQAYEQSIPGIKNEATKVWQYGKNLLNNMEENGLISKELRGTLEELYPHYVPYMQSESMVPYMDDSGEIKPKKVIKRAKGGAHDLVTIEEAFERYTYATKKAIRQNDLYKEIVKTSKEKVSFGADDRIDPTQLDNSLMRDAEGNNYLTAYVDGTQQQAKISDNLYQELTKTNELKVKNTESKYSLILKPIQKISEVRRNILTTWNPSFILTNSMKDIQDGMFNSKYTKDMIKNYPSAFYELATQSTETAQQFTSLYGSGMVMGEYQIDRLTNATRNMDINQLNSIIKSLPNANEIVELAPRYAEFKASLQNGASVTEAMYNAREVTTNFNRGGYITKALNRNGFTFLNASVQGFDKMIRNLTGVNGTKGFVASTTGIMLKVTALGIAPAMFNAMSFNAGDDDEDEAYKALPDYIKDNYYLIKVKGLGNKTSKYYDGTFLRIPKGRMLSVFGSAARRTLEYSKGDKNAFDGYLKNVESQIGINNPEENNIIAPIKQAFGSKNGEAWYGGDLVPKRLQNKPVAEQYDEGTDEFSKWLGKMINVSPYKINYLLDQYSGGAGDIILPMITKETTNGATSVGDYLIAPVKDKFIVNSTDDNKYASKFYTKLETLQTKNNSDTVSTSDKLKYKYMSSISSDMSKLYKEKREIQLDDSLTKKQKYKKVQNVQKEINKLAEEGIKEPKIKDLKSHYVKVENTEYYKNSKGSWTAIKDEEASELNSLRMSANEKSNYFKTKNKIGAIRNSDIKSSEKKDKISNLIVNMNMSDDKLAYIYGKYYSNEETLDIIQNAGISIKEFIKYNSQDIESDYYANGKAVPNSKKKKTIAYINSLNLSAIQKAMLIRMEYSSFTSYDKQIIQYINNRSLNIEDKKEILTSLGFKIRNGRVYSK